MAPQRKARMLNSMLDLHNKERVGRLKPQQLIATCAGSGLRFGLVRLFITQGALAIRGVLLWYIQNKPQGITLLIYLSKPLAWGFEVL